jgi:ComF family protein
VAGRYLWLKSPKAMPDHPVLTAFASLAQNVLHLFYPDLCVACDRELRQGDSCFCFGCQLKLTPSDMYRQQENEFTNRFWGRLPLVSGAALYYFQRRSPIQRALHQLKYHNHPDVALRLGRTFGRKLARAPGFDSVELIVPVPLHPRKERLRGYNQSALLARGLAETIGVPAQLRALQRRHYAESQTRKKRLERFKNVEAVFALPQPNLVRDRHVLLVDDVLTTGATLESCGRLILDVPGTRLSLATIAIAVL